MIWIVKGDNSSHEAVSTNIKVAGDQSELWMERPNGKTLMLFKGDEETVKTHKEAIDYAVRKGERTYEM